jgi:hypothetical protein
MRWAYQQDVLRHLHRFRRALAPSLRLRLTCSNNRLRWPHAGGGRVKRRQAAHGFVRMATATRGPLGIHATELVAALHGGALLTAPGSATVPGSGRWQYSSASSVASVRKQLSSSLQSTCRQAEAAQLRPAHSAIAARLCTYLREYLWDARTLARTHKRERVREGGRVPRKLGGGGTWAATSDTASTPRPATDCVRPSRDNAHDTSNRSMVLMGPDVCTVSNPYNAKWCDTHRCSNGFVRRKGSAYELGQR